MKIKVRLARRLSPRIHEQTRKERRALRDYSRQGEIMKIGLLVVYAIGLSVTCTTWADPH
jgi:hypothetical protein